MAEPLADIDTAAHVIQIALTPVFLISGIGTLLNLFNTRLARAADHNEQIAELLETEQDQAKLELLLTHRLSLQRRRTALELAIVLSALGAALTCCAVFVLFLGSLRESAVAGWLFGLFGGALLCTVASLVAFIADSLMASHGMRHAGPMPRPQPRTKP